ncbi:MAG: hypothetical protein MUD03_09820 [Pirellula sp.]|nr:hypothetical protein [Pirellula sp.]
MNDEDELIESALAGNSSSFEVLVCRYQDRLFTAMISVVGGAEEAEDVVQEAFIQAYLKLDTSTGLRSTSHWRDADEPETWSPWMRLAKMSARNPNRIWMPRNIE